VTQSLVGQGLELMLYGMGSVLVFLALLVLVTSLMSSLLGARGDMAVAPPAPAGRVDQAVDPRTLAVISAAIHTHRQRQLQSTQAAASSEGGPSQRRSSSS